MPISKGPAVARRRTRAVGPSDEALRIARTIVYCEACLDAEVPHAVAHELWAHDMKLPFAAGEDISVEAARLLEERAHRETLRDARTRRRRGRTPKPSQSPLHTSGSPAWVV
ncbi:hypothetical protein [Kitasatospora griseola]